MVSYRQVLIQAQRYLNELNTHLVLLGQEAPVLFRLQRDDTLQFITTTIHAMEGTLTHKAWAAALDQFLLWPTQPLTQLLKTGFGPHFETLTREPAYTAARWQQQLHHNPWRARRRYCHQVWLAHQFLGYYLLPSVVAFQASTGRQPLRFRPLAQQLVRAWLRRPKPLAAAGFVEQLWPRISPLPYPATTLFTGFAGPARLLQQAVEACARLPLVQALTHTAAHHSWPNRRRTAGVSVLGRSPVQFNDSLTQTSVQLLMIALEEATIPDPATGVPDTSATSALAPYPDERNWQQWFATDTDTARQHAFQLKLLEAHVGIFQPFNLGESLAIFHTLASPPE